MKTERGFSLIESLIALAILATGIVLSADLVVRGGNSIAYDSHSAMSIQIASALMEELSATFASDARLTVNAAGAPHRQYFTAQGIAVAGPDAYLAMWDV